MYEKEKNVLIYVFNYVVLLYKYIKEYESRNITHQK